MTQLLLPNQNIGGAPRFTKTKESPTCYCIRNLRFCRTGKPKLKALRRDDRYRPASPSTRQPVVRECGRALPSGFLQEAAKLVLS